MLALFVLALTVCLVLYAAVSVPGAWFPSATQKAFGVRDLTLTRGRGAIEQDPLKGDSLLIAAGDEAGLALVTLNSDLRSSDYPIVAWRGSGFPERADVRLLWRTDYAPARVNSVPLAIAAGRLTPLVMKDDPAWIGRITGIALAIRVPLADPVRIEGVVVKPGGFPGQLRDLARDWFAFERWSGTSINTVTGGAEVQDLPLPAVLVVAALVAAAAWLALAWHRRRMAPLPLVLATLFAVAWVVLDLQWTWNFARQVAETRAQYGGKDWRERHVVADDGALFQFIEKARARMPAAPVRVFVLADAAYFRGRGAYHLYPHNVLFDPFANTLPPVSALRPGDYVVVYHRRGVQYHAEGKRLRFAGGEPVGAEAVLVEPGAAVFRII